MSECFVVKFDWKGEGLLTTMDKAKEELQAMLVDLYNAASAAINERLDSWNKEWTDMGYDFPTGELFGTDYCKFNIVKQTEVLNEITCNGMLLSFGSDMLTLSAYYGDELELHLKLESKPINSWIDVSFHLEAA